MIFAVVFEGPGLDDRRIRFGGFNILVFKPLLERSIWRDRVLNIRLVHPLLCLSDLQVTNSSGSASILG